MGLLDGKVAIITGAGRGIGRATAHVFAKEGAAVAIVDIDQANAEAVRDELLALGGKAIAITCDVQNRSEVKSAVEETVKSFDGVDMLIQYAKFIKIGIPFEDVPEDVFVKIWKSGVMGSVFFMQECFPYMREKGGKIINTASGAGVKGSRNMSAYAIANEGIRGLTKSAARDWGQYNITVNVICPAALTEGLERFGRENPEYYQAAMADTPLGRPGDPELDIGRAVLALVGPDMGYLTGATIMLDGGANMIS